MLTIFLTGASGFIGQALLKKLLASQYRIICHVRSAAARDQVEALGGIAWQFELDRLSDLETQLRHCDVVIHLAAIKGLAGKLISSLLKRVSLVTSPADIAHNIASQCSRRARKFSTIGK